MSAPSNDDRSLFTLVGELPDRVSDLVRAELDQIKAEISYKLKHFGIGSGLFAAAAVVGIFLLFMVPLALIIARDATRHGRNAWAWGLTFIWQPVIVGVVYLVVRSRPPKDRTAPVVNR